MRIAIYSPYLDTLGGGEKYMMTIAEVLSSVNNVDVLLDKHLFNVGDNDLKNKLSERFDLNLNRVNFISGPVGKSSNFLQRFSFFKKYDLLFYLTDGSIFYSTAKRNILHIQSPLVGQPAKSFWGKVKLKGWNLIIYNSLFTKNHSTNNWPIPSLVIYPPVDTSTIKILKKNKFILSVGRFFGYLKDKKQEILIRVFKDFYRDARGWSLHLVGSTGEGDQPYLKQLKDLATGLPINFYPNLSHDKLIRLYGESSIYWHVSGFGEDDPTKMEHFGISTVESMAAGCVPVVINLGGQREIIDNGVSGYLWNNLEDLKEVTLKVIKDKNLWKALSKKAMIKADSFSKEKFKKNILKLL